MTDDRLRPPSETVECRGASVRIVDPDRILLAAAGPEPVELLHGAPFPGSLRAVTLTAGSRLSTNGPVYRFVGTARRAAGLDALRVGLAGPVGVMIARQMATKDPLRFAARTASLAGETIRRLGERPEDLPRDRTVVDAVSGLSARVTYDVEPSAIPQQVSVTVTAEAPRRADTALTPYLRGFVILFFEVLAELAGGELSGRYTLTTDPETADNTEKTTLDQVGGLDHIVSQLREVAVSFNHPEAMARWGARRPQGILLYGPPGTGKTMLATALANEIGGELREIRTPEILDRWLGASERNIKKIFTEARRYTTPTVLLFDEFDSIISYTGGGQDAAGQAINSVAGIFKQEMNTLIEANPQVIVVATTNFPDRVDASLTRSGRFDIKLSVPKPDTGGRAEIIAKMLRALIAAHETPGFRMFGDDVDARELAAASPGATGADIREALRRVQLQKAMQEARGQAPEPICQSELLQALTAVSPA
ncbi:transitional endoplasmic reticulum ATPase [Catenuloplanes nepalensis]|uniref:Transitional endoplasmic reticulum ATPase n=1 Tax=Catenuloplanes nepalensis TaxID=587533 RepID=A0ABT9MV32_9ACTN|nr:ATP-binding protein [Catenuloplanes nepalensis]MDP9795299.1 transitional endoplasmic reticulum ATPase [Catenuloplanes nepalensis]